MIHTKQSICLMSVLIMLACSSLVQAATYYVATTGSDGATCASAQSPNTPRQTIAGGLACLAGGDTLIFAAGTYSGQFYNPPAGSASAYTIIKAANGTRPKIVQSGQNDRGLYCDNGSKCSYVEIRGFEFSRPYDGVKLYGTDAIGYPHHINFINNIVHDTVSTGWLSASSATGYVGGDHLIQNNEFYNIGIGSPGYLPGMNTIYNPGNRTIIDGNTFHNCTHGIGIWTTGITIQNVIVRRNRFYDMGRFNIDTWMQGANSSMVIHISVPGGGHQISNNLIYRSGSQSTFVGISVGVEANSATSVYVYNNTIYNLLNPNSRAVLTNFSSTQIKNNIAYLAGIGFSGGTQSSNLTNNPSFMGADSGNFGLQTGSVAIDRGEAIAGVTHDYSGTARPQGAAYDVGAFEGSSSNSAPTAPRGLIVR